ncbi:ribbon-helix-helix protein, CopG family [Methanobacterium subterraneum]|nr:ribbon-helix-helix protein, CopG family [Methanobacterium subterraneum]
MSIDLKDLTEIQEKVKKGESNSVSEFVRNAIRKELKR